MEESRAIVEQALTTLGLVPSETLVSKAGASPAWTLKRGSAKVAVALVTREALGTSAVHLRVVAPLLVFADDTKAELFHHVLKLNAAGLSWCAFGVLGDSIVLVAERPTEDLDPSEVVHTVQHVAALADTFDDKLATEFGGQRSCDV